MLNILATVLVIKEPVKKSFQNCVIVGATGGVSGNIRHVETRNRQEMNCWKAQGK